MVKALCLVPLLAAFTGCGPQVAEQFRPRTEEWRPPDAPSDDGLFASWSDYYRYQAKKGSTDLYYQNGNPCDGLSYKSKAGERCDRHR
jgi:hypothetical protein